MRDFVVRRQLNVLTHRGDGLFVLLCSNYKKAKQAPGGCNVVEMTEDVFGWWLRLLEQYLSGGYRSALAADTASRFIFLDSNGPFGSAPFSDYLARLLFQLTGQLVAINLLCHLLLQPTPV